ncbi:MAG: hypothetical protein IJ170_00040 [Ruminococcus sp.]|nr:hypothetical protein [Ruminococcus sp.]
MKKRVFALCLACVMAASMTACGSSEESSKAKSSSVSDSSSESSSESKSDSENSKEESSAADSSAAETESVTTTTPADSSEPESIVDKDAVVVDTDNFEIDKAYYAYSEDANMWLQITHSTTRASRVVIVDNTNISHSIEGSLRKIKKNSYYTEGNDEIGIVWKYRDIEYKTKDDPMFPFPSNCKPLNYTINGSTVTFTFVEYKDNDIPTAEDYVEYIPNSERTVTFKFVTEDYFKANAPEVY